VSFLRDVQPVLDRHCVRCHTGLKPDGGVDLSPGLLSFDSQVAGYGHNRAYETILARNLVSISAARAQDASITPPLAYGSHRSRLLLCLTNTAHRDVVQLGEEDRLRLSMWIDANAPYHDRFVNKRANEKAYDIATDKELGRHITAVHERRCGACHKPAEVSRLDWINLRQPQHSLFLLAPLNKSAGGDQSCQGTVYKDTTDPDYQTVRELVLAAARKAWASPRRDLKTLIDEDLSAGAASRAP
jgi:mono/diheme cytochrome c family protein